VTAVKPRIVTSTLALATAIGVSACGASQPAPSTPTATQAAAIQAPAVDQIDLSTGSDRHKITSTIQAFYRTTWNGQGAAACSLFSSQGSSGFLKAARVAFPSSVNSTTSCAQAMAFFHAGLADQVDTLQQSGVNVSGNILDHVAVSDIHARGGVAAAEAPVGVDVLIKPKRFLLVRQRGQWLISGSQKIGKTLPQILAEAKAKGELQAKRSAGR
jgi:hypothetical protein